ncbi:hypothetical protein F5X97DRAFT_176011 [Nemania serpens]|nr:hypothetical protein F5X97DRAFT_176011 [Nemania serpens]
MKLTIATAVALTSAIVAQDLGGLSDCAKNCLAEFTTGNQIGNCARLNAKCICTSDAFLGGIACCLAGLCDADEQKQAVDYARSFCSTQGVTDLPQSVTCATASETADTPATASAPTVTTATVTPNAGASAVLGCNANFYGGLLAALALL